MMIKKLIKDSYKHYANKSMRHQWVRQTYELMTTGNHVILNGRFPRKVM